MRRAFEVRQRHGLEGAVRLHRVGAERGRGLADGGGRHCDGRTEEEAERRGKEDEHFSAMEGYPDSEGV
jgi:hypothetical protein